MHLTKRKRISIYNNNKNFDDQPRLPLVLHFLTSKVPSFLSQSDRRILENFLPVVSKCLGGGGRGWFFGWFIFFFFVITDKIQIAPSETKTAYQLSPS